MNSLFAILASLPELIRLIKRIISSIAELAEKEKSRKVLNEDIQKINRAFELNDPALLDELWNKSSEKSKRDEHKS